MVYLFIYCLRVWFTVFLHPSSPFIYLFIYLTTDFISRFLFFFSFSPFAHSSFPHTSVHLTNHSFHFRLTPPPLLPFLPSTFLHTCIHHYTSAPLPPPLHIARQGSLSFPSLALPSAWTRILWSDPEQCLWGRGLLLRREQRGRVSSQPITFVLFTEASFW